VTPKIKLLSVVSFIAVSLGIALQIQITIGQTEDYTGLRINVGDLLLLFAGILVFASLITNKTRWPQWRIKYGNAWIVILCVAMVLANANHYWVHGEWSRWGLLNKGIGWLVLMSYFALGAWMSTNFGETILRKFMKPFLMFFVVTLPIFLAPLILQDLGIGIIAGKIYPRLDGLMANRNAYGFLLVTCLLFGTLSAFIKKPLISLRWVQFLWGMFPLTLVYNGSRTCLIVSAIVFVYLLATQRKNMVKFVVPLIIGTLVLFILVNPASMSKKFRTMDMDSAFKYSEEGFDEEGFDNKPDMFRYIITMDALELWQKHPVFGAGLGSFMVYQTEKRGELIDIIHNTAFWIMTEIGIVGLSLFIAFYIMCLRALWQSGRLKGDIYSNFCVTTFLFLLLCFAPMSLMHEFLYTRHMWMIMGLALAVPVAIRTTDENNLNYSSG
jgi:O-antigen ligase